MSVILLADIECITWKFHIYEVETKCARSFPLDGHNNVDDGMTDLWQTMCFGRGGGGVSGSSIDGNCNNEDEYVLSIIFILFSFQKLRIS